MTSLQNLFVAKLPRNLTDNDLEQIFVDYHPTSAKVMLDATTGKSKGFGFVLFESEEAGRVAYEKLNKTHVTLHGHNFNLCIFPSKHDGKVATEESNALYVRNIPLKLSQMEVEQFLRGFGPLTYCAMREDHFGGSVWVVYAEYDSVDSAKSALTSLHGNRTYFNNAVAILAKYADSEEAKRERRRRREQQQQPPPLPNQNQSETSQDTSMHGSSMMPPSGHNSGAGNLRNTPSPTSPVQRPCGQMPHSFSTPEMHMEGGSGPQLHPPAFASLSHHYAPGRGQGGAPPPPPMQSSQLTQSLPAFQAYPPPPPPQLQQPLQMQQPPMQQPPTPNSVGSFLNVTFNPANMTTNGTGAGFGHFAAEQTPSRGSPGTPLNFSFGHDADSSSAGVMPGGCGGVSLGGGMQEASLHTPRTPVRANSSLSIGSGYRHNPYAPVTPVSSSHNSTGPSTPVVSSTTRPLSPHVSTHFSVVHQQQVPSGPLQQGPPGFVSGHFGGKGNNCAFLAAPGAANEPMQ